MRFLENNKRQNYRMQDIGSIRKIFRISGKHMLALCLFLQTVVCHALSTTVASDSQIKFNHLNTGQNIVLSSVFDIAQDSMGAMWFVSWDGVYQYDGYTQERVCKLPQSLKNSQYPFVRIIKIQDGHIWVATSYQIFCWDQRKKTCKEFLCLDTARTRIDCPISAVAFDLEGNMWMGCRNGSVYCCDVATGTLSHKATVSQKGGAVIHQICVSEESLLLATSKGVFELVDKQKGKGGRGADKKWVLRESQKYRPFSRSDVTVLYEDSKKNLWVGTNKGAFFHKAESDDGYWEKISHVDRHILNYGVRSIKEYNDIVFLATEYGLLQYYLQKNSCVWSVAHYNWPWGLSDNSLYCVFIDLEGNVWLGTFNGGVNYISSSMYLFHGYSDIRNQLGGQIVSGITEDSLGNIWFALEDKGFSVWDRKNNTVSNYSADLSGTFKPSNNNVQSIYADRNKIYAGTFAYGMDEIDPQRRTVLNLRPSKSEDSEKFPSVYSFCKISDTLMLVGTFYNLQAFYPLKREFRIIPQVHGKIEAVEKDRNGDIWALSSNYGLYHYGHSSRKWSNVSQGTGYRVQNKNQMFTSMSVCDTAVFIGTAGNGLWFYHKKKHTFEKVPLKEFESSAIFSILSYHQDLWVTTLQSVLQFHPDKGTVTRYTQADGIHTSQFKTNAGYIASDGLMIVGGANGIDCFYPKDIVCRETPPKVMITDFFINNVKESFDNKEERNIAFMNKIELEESQNDIAFVFSSSSYSNISQNRYEYKLYPLEKEWKQTLGTQNTAAYTRLAPGDYTFSVRTVDKHGVWSVPKTIVVHIAPFWWKSWPMKTAYILLAGLLVGSVVYRYRRKKEEERQLFYLKKEQEEYESKINFFTFLTHEIRTPLTLIIGPLNQMLKTKEAQIWHPELEMMNRNAHNLLHLADELLTVQKIENQAYCLQPVQLNLTETIHHVVENFVLVKQNPSISIVENYPDEACWIEFDKDALVKIMTNLMSNALKFAKDRIWVNIEEGRESSFWKLSVADNGPGIALEEQENIFKTFYQSHTEQKKQGFGIGLTLVKKLVDLHQSFITLDSETGKGTRLSIEIRKVNAPACDATAKNVGSVLLPSVTAEADNGNGNPRVLVVEDNQDMQAYIRSVLSGEYEVKVCGNGEEALDEINKASFDLVLSDLMMPKMDGITLCRMLKKRTDTSFIPVVLLTAKTDEQSQREGLSNLADLYITKPFVPDILKLQIGGLLHNRALLQEHYRNEAEIPVKVLCHTSNDEEFLKQLNQLISEHLTDTEFQIDDLIKHFGMSRSQFYQKIKGICGMPPLDYLRIHRLKVAVRLFQKGETHIADVCYKVGFSTPSYFTKRFTQQFGISPSEFIRKMKKDKG